MTDAEKQVREYWKKVEVWFESRSVDVWQLDILTNIFADSRRSFRGHTQAEVLSAALAFTLENQEKVRQIEQELLELEERVGDWRGYLDSGYPINVSTIVGMIRGYRTIANLEGIRDNLLRGVRKKEGE